MTTPAPPEPESPHATQAWYLVHTKPRLEQVALANLERQGYECYLPTLRVERVVRRRATMAVEPLFARYLFIRLDSGGQGKSWLPIRSTLGVHQLVRFGPRPAKVADDLVDLLRQREQTLPVKGLFQSGQTVVIAAGPFAGLQAVYQSSDPQHRALILLELLGKAVTMTVDNGQLRAATGSTTWLE